VAASEVSLAIRQRLLGRDQALLPLDDMQHVATAAGAAVFEGDLAAAGGGCEALLIPVASNHFRIIVDPTPRSGWGQRHAEQKAVHRQRVRFRVAHELGHTLFYRRFPTQVPSRARERSQPEEDFCDRFARALLVPDSVLRDCREPEHLVDVQQAYDVSLEVALRGLAEVLKLDAALFFWNDRDHRPVVQWTNLPNQRRLGKWRRATRAALSDTRISLNVQSAKGLMLPRRRQALVLQSR
jgi:hypothetical protein